MLSIYDNDTLAAALTQPIDPELAQMLQNRWALAESAGLQDCTHLLVLQAGDEEAEVEQEIGFRLTSHPIDGARYGSESFHPYWPWLADLGGHYEMIVAAGTDYAFHLLIEKADGVPQAILQMCQEYTREDAACG